MEDSICSCCGNDSLDVQCCSCCSAGEFDTDYFSIPPSELESSPAPLIEDLEIVDSAPLDTKPFVLPYEGCSLSESVYAGSGFFVPDSLSGGGSGTIYEPYVLPTMSKVTKGGAKVGKTLVMTDESLNVALGTEPLTLEGGMWISDS